MKALVGAFNQEKAVVGAFPVIVQPVVEPMDRFAILVIFTCKLGEAAVVAAVRALEEVLVLVVAAVGGAGLDGVGGEALAQGVHVLRPPGVGRAHVALEAGH